MKNRFPLTFTDGGSFNPPIQFSPPKPSRPASRPASRRGWRWAKRLGPPGWLSLCLGMALAGGAARAQAPRLQVVPMPSGQVHVSWPYPSTGFVLQSSPTLAQGQWRDVEAPVELLKERKAVTLPLSSIHRFFRLRSGCTDFREFPPGRLPSPFVYLKTSFAPHNADGSPMSPARIVEIGGLTGLDVGFLLEVDLGQPCLKVEATLATFSGLPASMTAFNPDGLVVGTASTSGAPATPETIAISGGGQEIVRVRIEAPQDETLLLGFCCRHELDAAGDYYNPYGVEVDEVNQVNFVDVDKAGRTDGFRRLFIPLKNIYREPFKIERKEDQVDDPPPPSKISPVLEEWLATKDPREVVELLITFPEDSPIPLLPDLGPNEDRERGNTRRSEAIAQLQKARWASQEKILIGLRRLADTQVFEPTESFWLVNSVLLKTELGAVRQLAKSEQVTYLQPVEGGEKPPADGNPNNDAQDGRALIVSDPYFNLGLTQPWIGLLDTGIRPTHVLFNSPSHIAWLRDCVNGGPNCNQSGNPGYDPTDFAWNHGTCSAGIITGNSRLGNAFRGVTEVRLDSWQIYRASGLSSAAAVRAIQAGVAAFDKVLVGEIQANESETGSIATAADNAYNAGVIFVSANGNFGPNSSTVRSPGIAHKVLGVGGFMTDGGAQYNNQGRGPATDGRYKPDIQAPTWSETASASSDNALKVFTGTSGATPYAAASAMLARNWLHKFGTYDNGQTYAFMILYGQNPWPYDNTEGAGRLQMAVNGHAWWGKLFVGNGSTIDIPISVSGSKRNFDAALWWPESASQTHNDVDVHLIDPSGIERAKGYSGVSVFERTRVAGNLATGTWKIRVRGYNVPTGSQVVYWAAHIQNN